VTKVYRPGRRTVTGLRGVRLTFPRGSCTAVMGASGSGKTTLLQCAAGLDRPTSGTVRLAGQDLGELSESQVTRLRRDRVGFVFQSFNLVPSLTVELNVALPARLAGRRCRRPEIRDALGAVGLADRAGCRPSATAGRRAELAALRLAGATRGQVLRLAGTEAALVAALGTGLGAVVTAVTLAAVRRGLAGVAPAARVAIPWPPLLAIALACLVAAMLGSVATVAAALRDPGQDLATAAAG
jgi:putative ABC transport system ATP-binding protein